MTLKNDISLDFKAPSRNFFIKNEYLFKEMKKSFIEVLNQKYDIIEQ